MLARWLASNSLSALSVMQQPDSPDVLCGCKSAIGQLVAVCIAASGVRVFEKKQEVITMSKIATYMLKMAN